MWRELEERMKIVAENTNARVFSASYNPRYGYPYRLMHADAAMESVREQCYEFIIDSSYNDPDISNRDVLQAAIDCNADYCIPKDFPGEPDRTFDSLREFVSLYQDYESTAIVMAPIQPPYREHYHAHADFYDQFSHFAIGGLQTFDTTQQQIAAIRRFREAVGDHRYIHALGVGTTLSMIRALRSDDPFVDSIDISTAERAVKNGMIPDKTWQQKAFELPTGPDSTTVRAQYAKAILYQLNYMLSRLVEDDILEREYESTELAGFATSTLPDGTGIDSCSDRNGSSPTQSTGGTASCDGVDEPAARTGLISEENQRDSPEQCRLSQFNG
jgi:hypothetical protein